MEKKYSYVYFKNDTKTWRPQKRFFWIVLIVFISKFLHFQQFSSEGFALFSYYIKT